MTHIKKFYLVIDCLKKDDIDIDLFAQLVASNCKDPSDKRYDPIVINILRLESTSVQNFANRLFVHLFDQQEINTNRTVYGRINQVYDRCEFINQPLDPDRINFIKKIVLNFTITNNQDLIWATCVKAMNNKMFGINRKLNNFAKSQQKPGNFCFFFIRFNLMRNICCCFFTNLSQS